MKRFVTTVILVCALALTAMAGQVPTGGAPQPPPPAGFTQTTSDITGGYTV